MDRRTNDRQRPAGDPAGRRGPPQNYQQNNAPWGNQQMWFEEYQSMCHIKHLQELLEARDRGFRSECKKYSEQICELEQQNNQLTLALQHQEKESKQRFDEMVARYEAEKQTKQELRQEVESQVRSEYQEKVAHMEKQIHQMGTDLLKLRQEQQGLLQTLAEAHTELSSKDAALQQSEEAWQAKYDALNEKATTDMEENSKSRETQEDELNIKVNLMEEQIHQRDIEILRLTEDNNCLAKELAETAQQLTSRDAELLQSQTAWQEKLVSLRDNFYKDVEEKQQSWETQQTQLGVKLEAEICQRDVEILRLTEDNASLSQKLSETTEELTVRDAELLQSQTAWQEKFVSLRDKFSEDIEERRQSWETQQTHFRIRVNLMEAEICQRDTEILSLCTEKDSLTKKLSETIEKLTVRDAELLQSHTSWQEKFQSLDNFYKDAEEKQQSWEIQQTQLGVKLEAEICQRDVEILRLTEDNASLSQKLSETTEELTVRDAELLQSHTSWQEKFQSLKDNFYKDVEEKQQSWETQLTQLRVKLEAEICQRDVEILRLTEDNASLSQKLSETTEELTVRDAELHQSHTSWQGKFQSLDNFYKDAEEKQQSWEIQQTQLGVKLEAEICQRDVEILRLTEDNASLSQKLSETTEELTVRDAKLLQSQTAWQEKFQSLKDNFYKDVEEKQQSWETQQTQLRVKLEAEICQRDVEILRLTEDNASLSQKLSETTEELTRRDAQLRNVQLSWQDRVTSLENISKYLAEKKESLETEVAQLRADKVELEDLCLYINKKRKRFLFFPRRSSDDRETQLQKLKSKMLQKAARTRADEKEEEEMEAAGCSAQAGQQ